MDHCFLNNILEQKFVLDMDKDLNQIVAISEINGLPFLTAANDCWLFHISHFIKGHIK